MDHTKQSIDMLFSNAATINDYEFHQRFKKIMKNSEISIKKSGMFIFFYSFLILYFII